MSGSKSSLQLSISYKSILKIAIPISGALLIPQLNFITNNIFIGGLGEQELAIAGITGVYYLIFAVMGYGLNNGLQALISRRAGQNEVKEIGVLFNNGLIIALAIASIGILFTYTIAPYILSFAMHSSSNVELSMNFLKIRIWGLPFLFMFQMRNGLLIGINRSKLIIHGTIIETFVNIFLDYSLIYGKFGMPALGFNGAAIASVIAEVVGMLVVYFVIRRKQIHQEFSIQSKWNFINSKSRLIIVQSSPLILQHVLSIVSWYFFYLLIEHHGNMDLAISNVMRNIFGLFGCITWAFAATSNTMVSNIIGQNFQDRVWELIAKISKLSVGFALLVALFLNIFPEYFLYLFNQSPEFIKEAIPVVRVVSVALILMAFSTVFLNAVTGTGNTKINLKIEIVAITLYCIYVYTILEKLHLPILYGWLSEWIYWTSIFIPCFIYLKSGKWRDKKI
jgi:MATE family multidrug resistance protein